MKQGGFTVPEQPPRIADLNPTQQRLVRVLADIAKRLGKRS